MSLDQSRLASSTHHSTTFSMFYLDEWKIDFHNIPISSQDIIEVKVLDAASSWTLSFQPCPSRLQEWRYIVDVRKQQ